MTARELISSSLRLLGVLSAGMTANVQDATDGLATLKAMIESWNTEPYITVPDPLNTTLTLATELDIPEGYIRALRYNLAIDLAPEYGVEPSAAIVAIAQSAKEKIKAKNITTPPLMTVDKGLTFPDLVRHGGSSESEF